VIIAELKLTSNMRSSGRDMNKLPLLTLPPMIAMTRCRAAQLWR
jgi:hypothetical protein